MQANEIRAVRPPEGEESFSDFALQEIAAQLSEMNGRLEMLLVEIQKRNNT